MFSLVEFTDESGGSLSVIRKKEMFWPSTKESKKFEKILLSENQTFDDKWKLYSFKRCLYESDDYEVIKKKLRRAEDTSDLQSKADEVIIYGKVRNVASQQQLEVLEPVAECSIPILRSSTPQSSLSGLDSSILCKKINK
ncbi:hypothetical protein RN001_001738 [Aquatica leii]|uniref:Uncharacterized protein n=1 Tax=Aquatica leii TaxID=1421715 RepID=A0AAN7SJQ1_9COLE|nr:hypothetical protein RN001_001738 [Aquatica leii]